MLKIGITGSIGSGKSTVCRVFELLGIPIYDADYRAKALMIENRELKDKIIALFGSKAYNRDGGLDRKALAEIVFNDEKKLEALNSLVHPAVAKDSEAWHLEQNAAYTLKEAALLIESGSHHLLDKIIIVAAPQTVRIRRVMHRDNVTKEEVLARETKQLSSSEKLKHADYVIENHKEDLVSQVLKIHRSILDSPKH